VKVCPCVAARVLDLAQEQDVNMSTPAIELPSDRGSVAAVIALSAYYQDLFACQGAESFFGRFDGSFGGVLHQYQARDAIPLSGEPIHLSHLSRRQYLHNLMIAKEDGT